MFDTILGHYLKSKLFHFHLGGIGGIVRAKAVDPEVLVRNALRRKPLVDLLEDPHYDDLKYDILKEKSGELFAKLKGEIGSERFDGITKELIERHRFTAADRDVFIASLEKHSDVNFSEFLDRWKHETEFPRFHVYDAAMYETVLDGTEVWWYTFSIHNSGKAEGALEAHIGEQFNNIARSIILDAGQAKRIGVIYKNLEFIPRGTIGFKTYNALNDRLYADLAKPRRIDASEVFDGERIIEPPPDTGKNPNELIVDNLDTGFSIETVPWVSPLARLLNKDTGGDHGMENMEGFNCKQHPDRWSLGFDNLFYGSFEKTAYYIRAGDGDQRVAWKAELPEGGRFDVYAFFPPKNLFRTFRGYHEHYTVNDMVYEVHHDDGDDEISVSLDDVKPGWWYLGTFRFSKGSARIELSDKSSGDLVFADAVKWVKKSGDDSVR